MQQVDFSNSTTSDKGHPSETLTLLGLQEDGCIQSATPQIISHIADMEAIRDHWQDLETASVEPLSHFQSYDWCMNWVKHCHDDTSEDISIIPFWKNGELVALLPLMITTEKAGVRVMRFLGEPIIEYSNMLVDKSKIDADELIHIWNSMRGKLSVDAFVFKNFPACSSLFDIFGQASMSPSPSIASSIMDLTRIESWDAFRAGMSRSARRSRNKRRNKLAKMGEVSYRVYEGGSQEYKNIVARSVMMKQQWLQETGRNVGDLFEENAISAVSHMSGSLEKMDGAIAGALMVDDRIVATEVGYLQKDTYLSYIGAFDWDMRDYSVGKLQIEDALKWSFENGVKIYDFLGEPSVYKSDWSNGEVPLYCCHHGVSVKGYVYANLWRKKGRPLLKKAFLSLPMSLRKHIMCVRSA